MRYFACCTILLLMGCGSSSETTDEPPPPVEETSADFLDPVVVDAEHYKLEFENDYVRVLREKLAAGEGGAMHSHRARVSVYLKDAEVELTPRGGETVTGTLAAGSARWGEPTTHIGVTKSDVENLSIELQELGDEAIPLSDVDATKVDAEHHVVEFENDRVRIVRMTYPAGKTSPVHEHLPGFSVVLTDFESRNVGANGEGEVTEGKAGDAGWSDGSPPHATENLGDADLVVIRVELKKKPS